MNKRQRVLAKLAGASPAAAVGKLAAHPEMARESNAPPPTIDSKGDRCRDIVREIVETAFPHGEVIFRPAAGNGSLRVHSDNAIVEKRILDSRTTLEGSAKSHKKSYLARPFATGLFYSHSNRQSEWYRTMLRNGGSHNNLPPMFPVALGASSTCTNHAPLIEDIAIGVDAVVYLGGYAPTDLHSMVVEKLATVIPLDKSVAKYDKDAITERNKLENNKIQNYLRKDVVATVLRDKGCILHRDVLELSVPVPLQGRLLNTALPFARQSLFLSVGDPEWFPSQLNLIDREEDRKLFRPAFGYSEHLLMQRLPQAITGAARMLQRQFDTRPPWIINRQTAAPSDVVPLVFWLSCVAHVLAQFDGEVPSSSQALINEVKRLLSSEDAASSLAIWRWNYFLPAESFQSLAWWNVLTTQNRR